MIALTIIVGITAFVLGLHVGAATWWSRAEKWRRIASEWRQMYFSHKRISEQLHDADDADWWKKQ